MTIAGGGGASMGLSGIQWCQFLIIITVTIIIILFYLWWVFKTVFETSTYLTNVPSNYFTKERM